jgi:hypothetical protein
MVKLHTAYFLAHNGLGDNITSIGAINFLSNYFETIYFLCKNIYANNVKLLLNQECVKIVPFDAKNEFDECANIITNAYNNDNTINVFIAGCHKNYLISNITHCDLINYIQDDKGYTIPYDFIKSFYYDIGLDLSIYYDYFNISSSVTSIKYYEPIKNYNIIFLHTLSSTMKVDLSNIINKYIYDTSYIMICANTNVYPTDHEHYNISNTFVNIELAHYIDVIKNAKEIHIIDSCFSAMVHPLQKTNKIRNDCLIKIYHRCDLEKEIRERK